MTIVVLIGLAIKASIFLTVLGLGLDADWEDVTYLFRRPSLLVRSILSLNVLMVIFAVAIATAFDVVAPAIKIALVSLAMSPVPPIFPKKLRKAGGKSSYAIGLVVTAALFSLVLIPGWLELLGRYFGFEVDEGLRQIIPIVLISIMVPLFLGILIRRLAPRFAERALNPVSVVGAVLLVISALPILFKLAPAMWGALGHGVLWTMTLFGVVGIVVGHLLGGPDLEERGILALATSTRHPGIALAIATLNFPQRKDEVMVIVVYHLLVGAIVAIPYNRWHARRLAKLAAG
jgi:bile acid:Na+ symporter, BASS family